MDTLVAVDWLSEFRSVVPDEAAAVRYFSEKRWRRGAFCVYCGSSKLYYQPTLDRYRCARCDHTFSVRVRTFLHRSRQPLQQWLAAIWLATHTEKAVTIRMLRQELKINASAAWQMLSQLRCASRTQSFLRAAVPVVEEPIRPTEKNVHKGHYDEKMKLAMSFDEAVERLADVTIDEINAVKASRLGQRRAQKKGWRGWPAFIRVEEIEVEDDLDAFLVAADAER